MRWLAPILLVAGCSPESRCVEEIYAAAIAGSVLEDTDSAREAAAYVAEESPDCQTRDRLY